MRRLTVLSLLLGSVLAFAVEAQPADWSTLFVRAMRLKEAGQYAQAIPLAEQALTLAQAQYGPENRSVGLALNLLGQLYTAEGKYDEAEAFLKRALDIYHRWFGAQSPESAGVLNNLGRLYLDRGRPEQAVSVLQEALARFEQAYGPENHRLRYTLELLAEAYQAMNRPDEARRYAARAAQLPPPPQVQQ